MTEAMNPDTAFILGLLVGCVSCLYWNFLMRLLFSKPHRKGSTDDLRNR